MVARECIALTTPSYSQKLLKMGVQGGGYGPVGGMGIVYMGFASGEDFRSWARWQLLGDSLEGSDLGFK